MLFIIPSCLRLLTYLSDRCSGGDDWAARIEDTHSTFKSGEDWANRSESPIYQRAVGYQYGRALAGEAHVDDPPGCPSWIPGAQRLLHVAFARAVRRGPAFSYQVLILRQLDAFAGLD
ncbi:hypothetical protein C8R44DRAFT_879972 [Mycena epipterygia]|nr:hypothetical protein C8R44DRAFT_879972 [Mycena epipterygia]